MSTSLHNIAHIIAEQRWADLAPTTQAILQHTPTSQHAELLCRIAGSLADAQRWTDSLHYYQQALDLATHHELAMQIEGWLAVVLAQLNQYDVARDYATRSLLTRDELLQKYSKNKKIVSFSLYGKQPAYCETLILNAHAMPHIYPDWVMRVYHDDSIPHHVLTRLQQLNVECVNITQINANHMPGTFWRFLALADWACDAVLMRDADSLITQREQQLVTEWLASDKPFHVIRDWFGHTDVILAGLWGARGGFLGDIRERIDDYLNNTPNLHPTHADQMFLAQHIWPRIKPYTLHHSSLVPFPNAQWSPQLPELHRTAQGKIMQLGSWQLTHYAPQTNQPYTVLLTHQHNHVFAEYHFEAGETFELPRSYREAIEAGTMKLHILPRMNTKQGG